MKKLILTILTAFIVAFGFSQPVQQRGTSKVTVMDVNLFAGNSFRVPIYNDTASANLSGTGLDSAGKLIYTYNTNTVWLRGNNPKSWISIGTGGSNLNDTIYVRAPLGIDSTTYSGHRIMYLIHQDGLVSGGIVTWLSAENYGISPADYFINGKEYNSPFSQVTLTADATYPVSYQFYVDSTSSAGAIRGTPATNPIIPQVNPRYQIGLTSLGVTVNANDTVPTNLPSDLIYDENDTTKEWKASSTTLGAVLANYGSTSNPYHLLKSIYVQSYNYGALQFTKYGIDTAYVGEVLSFWVYSNGIMLNPITVYWQNGSTVVSNIINLQSGNYGFNASLANTWQNVVIPFSSFNFNNGGVFNILKIGLNGVDISLAKGLFVDYIRLLGGISNVNNSASINTNGVFYVPTISALENTNVNYSTIYVQDSLRGGPFNLVPKGTPDSITIFKDMLGRIWKRQYNNSEWHTNWAGIVNDGVTNQTSLTQFVVNEAVASSVKQLDFDAGTYILDNLTVQSPTIFTLNGIGNAILKKSVSSNDAFLIVGSTNNNVENLTVTNITLDGNADNQTTRLLGSAGFVYPFNEMFPNHVGTQYQRGYYSVGTAIDLQESIDSAYPPRRYISNVNINNVVLQNWGKSGIYGTARNLNINNLYAKKVLLQVISIPTYNRQLDSAGFKTFNVTINGMTTDSVGFAFDISANSGNNLNYYATANFNNINAYNNWIYSKLAGSWYGNIGNVVFNNCGYNWGNPDSLAASGQSPYNGVFSFLSSVNRGMNIHDISTYRQGNNMFISNAALSNITISDALADGLVCTNCQISNLNIQCNDSVHNQSVGYFFNTDISNMRVKNIHYDPNNFPFNEGGRSGFPIYLTNSRIKDIQFSNFQTKQSTFAMDSSSTIDGLRCLDTMSILCKQNTYAAITSLNANSTQENKIINADFINNCQQGFTAYSGAYIHKANTGAPFRIINSIGIGAFDDELGSHYLSSPTTLSDGVKEDGIIKKWFDPTIGNLRWALTDSTPSSYTNGTPLSYIYAGSGNPTGIISAPIGSIYRNTAGSSTFQLYTKKSGTDANNWYPLADSATQIYPDVKDSVGYVITATVGGASGAVWHSPFVTPTSYALYPQVVDKNSAITNVFAFANNNTETDLNSAGGIYLNISGSPKFHIGSTGVYIGGTSSADSTLTVGGSVHVTGNSIFYGITYHAGKVTAGGATPDSTLTVNGSSHITSNELVGGKSKYAINPTMTAVDSLTHTDKKYVDSMSALNAYTFSTGLNNSSGTITNKLSTGVIGGQGVVGGTAASDTLGIKATSGTGTTGSTVSIIVRTGDNGAKKAITVNNNGFIGFGGNPDAAYSVNVTGDILTNGSFKYGGQFIPSSGTMTVRDGSGNANTVEITGIKDIQSGGTTTSTFKGKVAYTANQTMAAIDSNTLTNKIYVDSVASAGTYLPTLTNTTNVSSSSADTCTYSRNGNIVTVGFDLNWTPTAVTPTTTVLTFTIPIAVRAGGFPFAYWANGSANCENGALSYAGTIAATVNGTTVTLTALSPSSTPVDMKGTFQYRIN